VAVRNKRVYEALAIADGDRILIDKGLAAQPPEEGSQPGALVS